MASRWVLMIDGAESVSVSACHLTANAITDLQRTVVDVLSGQSVLKSSKSRLDFVISSRRKCGRDLGRESVFG